MKKTLLAICTLSLLAVFASCNKDVQHNDQNQEPENNPVVADANKDDAKSQDTAAEPAKEPSIQNDAKTPTVTLAVDLCKIGEIPADTQILNQEIKDAIAGCKEGKTDPFNLKLAESYKFDLAISYLSIQLDQFNKHEKLEDTIREINSMAQYEPNNVKIEDAQELSKRHGIDIKKVTFITGSNEDTLFHENYVYSSVDHDYLLEMTMHEDELQDLKDKFIQNLVFVK